MVSMKVPPTHPAIADVLVNGVSINQAARNHGLTAPTLRVAVMRHPDYEKAKAEGKLRERLAMDVKTAEELRAHPAVVDAVSGEMSYDQAAAKHGIHPKTLGRWVQKAHPGLVAKRGPGGRPKKMMPETDQATLMVLTMIRQLAQAQGSDPVKVCRNLMRRLEADAALTP